MTAVELALIADHLEAVAALRRARAADPALGTRARQLKAYQAERFRRTYADLLADPRHRAAAGFFLDELYGPQDFADRDAQFGRVVPKIARVFPGELLGTVARLAELHALSERLDQAMAGHLPMVPVMPVMPAAPGEQSGRPPPAASPAWGALGPADYVRAWQAVGDEPARRQQIALTTAIGQALEGYTRSRFIHATLRLMRKPAQAAGLGDLQHFLEAGFDAFAAMRGSQVFLTTVNQRETRLMDALFAAGALERLARGRAAAPADDPLRDLPGR